MSTQVDMHSVACASSRAESQFLPFASHHQPGRCMSLPWGHQVNPAAVAVCSQGKLALRTAGPHTSLAHTPPSVPLFLYAWSAPVRPSNAKIALPRSPLLSKGIQATLQVHLLHVPQT
jgi:hypothetical protein